MMYEYYLVWLAVYSILPANRILVLGIFCILLQEYWVGQFWFLLSLRLTSIKIKEHYILSWYKFIWLSSNIVSRSIAKEYYTYLSSKLWFLLIWTSILSVLGDSLLDDPKTSWVERILNEWGRLHGYACSSKIIIY